MINITIDSPIINRYNSYESHKNKNRYKTNHEIYLVILADKPGVTKS